MHRFRICVDKLSLSSFMIKVNLYKKYLEPKINLTLQTNKFQTSDQELAIKVGSLKLKTKKINQFFPQNLTKMILKDKFVWLKIFSNRRI